MTLLILGAERAGMIDLIRGFRRGGAADRPVAVEESATQAATAAVPPVRVLFVEQAIAFGGAFVVIAELIRRMRRERVQPLLVTAMEPRFVAERLGSAGVARPLRHRLDYARIERLRRWFVRRGVPRRLASYLATAFAAVANIGYSIRLLVTVIRERPDVIHVNNGTEHMESNLGLFLLARRCVAHAHGMGTPSYLQRIFLNRASRVVAVSGAVRDALVRGGVHPDRIVIVPNPVTVHDRGAEDAGRRVRARHSLPDRALVFGIVGRLVRWKGHREFLLAAAKVMRSVGNAYAMILGGAADLDPGYDAELRRMARELGIEDRVVFTGYVADIGSYYRALDLVVHCSIEPEPFGLVITEAMASGVPVIAASQGAPCEIITHGVDGLLIDPRDTESLSEAIRKLLGDSDRRAELARRARAMVMQRYDPDRYAHRMEAIYRQVARRSSKRRLQGHGAI